MNILFLTLLGFESIQERTIYTDLLREFVRVGHHVYAISPVERRQNQPTHVVRDGNAVILRLRIGNTQKTNRIEKGISTVMIQPIFRRAIRQYFSDVKFDLVLYSTPPITLVGASEYVKKRDGAKTYLLLKDIFPQNAVDIGMMGKSGLRGLLYRHFRRQEKKLYGISDRIGCMSQANVDYLLRHNPEIDPAIVAVCPNSVEIVDKSVDAKTRAAIREKYGIPTDRKVFLYGGNLGKPQGIPFLIECMQKCSCLKEAYFLVVGDGTEYGVIEDYVRRSGQQNLKLMRRLPKEDYDSMVGACDVGLIFLDHRFTIPNFPSRILSYMQAKVPVLAATDTSSDMGKMIEDARFGWWVESNDAEAFLRTVREILKLDLAAFRENEWRFLNGHFSARSSAETIIRSFGD